MAKLSDEQKLTLDVQRAFHRLDAALADFRTSAERAARNYPANKLLADTATMATLIGVAVNAEVKAAILAEDQ